METKDILMDVLKHTNSLGVLNKFAVHGTSKTTKVEAIDPDRLVVMKAEFKKPVKDFIGSFGVGSLPTLQSLVKVSNYQGEDATIHIKREERDGEEVPSALEFADADGNRDYFRFMSQKQIEQTMKVPAFKGVVWNLSIEPEARRVAQLSEAAGIYAGSNPNFSVKTEGSNLVVTIGMSDAGGRRIFAQNVDGKIENAWNWPLNIFLGILKLGGDISIHFSDQGACQIDVDSGIAVYKYILPALTNTD